MYRLKQSARVFGQSARAFGRQFATLSAPRVANTTLLSVAIGAGVGVLAVSAVQAATSSSSTENGFKDPVRKRLQNTYGYVAVNLAATAGAAAMLFRSGVVHRLMAVNPIVLGIGSVAAMIGSMYLTRSIDYHESPFAKHLALSTFVGCQALMMAPLASLGGPLLMRFGETISFFLCVCVLTRFFKSCSGHWSCCWCHLVDCCDGSVPGLFEHDWTSGYWWRPDFWR